MKRLNKTIALLLVLLLAFSSFGITAFAEGSAPETTTTEETTIPEDDATSSFMSKIIDLVDTVKRFIQSIKDFVYGILGIVKPVYVPVDGITIDDTLLYLQVGDTLTIAPTISPENASKKQVVWTSSDESVATVNANGAVLGVSGGYVVITATVVDGGMTASVQVLVGDITVPADGSIQAAIDAAAPGQVIAVAPGLYSEQLTINKPLTLLAPKAEYLHNDEAIITYPENADITNGSLLSVNADNVSIKGFSFVNEQATAAVGAKELVFTGDNISFINNRVVSMGDKVALYFGDSNAAVNDRAGVVIRGNDIESNSSYATLYVENTGAFITENSIFGGSVALQVSPKANTAGGSVAYNILAAVDAVVLHDVAMNGSAAWTYEGNILTSKAPGTANRWSDESWRGFAVQNFGVSGNGADPTVSFTGNTFEMPEDFNETLWADVIGFHFMAGISDTAVFEIAGNEVNDVTIGAVMESGQADLSLILADNTFPEGSLVIGNEIKVPAWTDYADTSWYDPSASVFTITTAEELTGLAVLVNGGADFSGKTVNLGADINLTGIEWVPIGNAVNAFAGFFDGNNYTISGLEITDTTLAYVGLFGFVRGSVQIKNLTVSENIEIVDSKFANLYVGGIVGAGEFSGAVGQAGIVNVTVQGTLTVDVNADDANVYTGGIIGQAKPYVAAPYMLGFAITDSAVDLQHNVNLDGESNVYSGGLAGAIYNDAAVKTKVEFKNSVVNGAINITGTVADSERQAFVGGLFGYGVKNNTAATQNVQFVLTNCTAVTPTVDLDVATIRYSDTWGRNDWVQASIGDTYYASWADTAAAIQNGQTVIFYGDELIVDKKVMFRKNDITLKGLTDADGNPKTTFKGAGNSVEQFRIEGYNVTLRDLNFDSIANGGGARENNGVYFYYPNNVWAADRVNKLINCHSTNTYWAIFSGIKLSAIIEDCTFENTNNNAKVYMDRPFDVTIRNSVFKNDDNKYGLHIDNGTVGGVVTVIGSSITGVFTTAGDVANTTGAGNLTYTFRNCDFYTNSGTDGSWLSARYANDTIFVDCRFHEGFEGIYASPYAGGAVYLNSGCTFEGNQIDVSFFLGVGSGVIAGVDVKLDSDGKIIGGTFKTDPTANLATGYTATLTGSVWVVS